MFHLNPAEWTIVGAATAAALATGIRAGRRDARRVVSTFHEVINLDPETRSERFVAEGTVPVLSACGLVITALHYAFGRPSAVPFGEVLLFGLWLWSVRGVTAYATSLLLLQFGARPPEIPGESHNDGERSGL